MYVCPRVGQWRRCLGLPVLALQHGHLHKHFYGEHRQQMCLRGLPDPYLQNHAVHARTHTHTHTHAILETDSHMDLTVLSLLSIPCRKLCLSRCVCVCVCLLCVCACVHVRIYCTHVCSCVIVCVCSPTEPSQAERSSSLTFQTALSSFRI